MNHDIKEKKIITEQEIDKKKGIVYEFENDDNPNRQLPNANKILDEVIKILECMNTSEMIELKKTNNALFEDLMEEKFPEFTSSYYGVFKAVISGMDLEPLYTMLEIISKVNKGTITLETAEGNVGKYLSKFLPKKLLAEI